MSGAGRAAVAIREIHAAAQADEYIGWCKRCGASRDGCEHDAQRYRCESCGAREVYGLEFWLLWASGGAL